VLEWLTEDDVNSVIERIRALIKVIDQKNVEFLKDVRIQSEIEDLKEAFDSKDIVHEDCENKVDLGFDFDFDLDLDFSWW
jgi:hypothetical protein